MALHRAGWSNKNIADEMACSEASVSIILKEESGKHNEERHGESRCAICRIQS